MLIYILFGIDFIRYGICDYYGLMKSVLILDSVLWGESAYVGGGGKFDTFLMFLFVF